MSRLSLALTTVTLPFLRIKVHGFLPVSYNYTSTKRRGNKIEPNGANGLFRSAEVRRVDLSTGTAS